MSLSDRAKVVKMERRAIGCVSILRTPFSSERILSPRVSSENRLSMNDTTLPTANSVPEALRQATAHTRARRQLALLATTAQRHAVQRLRCWQVRIPQPAAHAEQPRRTRAAVHH